jgi:predicted polyphosphate/ATP-dependent NAD kinase
MADTMRAGVLYIVGPGSTTASIAKAMGADKTLLGVDVYLDKRLLRRDADEKALLGLLSQGAEAEVIVTPIGSQGFFLGRGNQQISPKVLAKVGLDKVVVVATPTKLAGTKTLRIDTGDQDIDRRFRRPTRVVTGYKRRKLVQVR